MTWANRLRLFTGLIVVIAIVAAATLVLSVRETEVASSSASVKAITYSVGSDFAGTVVEEKAKTGDTVKKGQPLMTIQSAAVETASATKAGIPSSEAYSVAAGGMLTLNATGPGVIESMGAHVGGFVSAGSALATIDQAGSLYVLAKFRIDPYDFSRIHKGARVDLVMPNQQQLSGIVSQIHVTTTTGGSASASIEVTSPHLVQGRDSGLVTPGTPVAATLHLRDDGPLGGLRVMVVGLLQKLHL
ncbi:HlyD family efflux transporter periplasmic adaptor subunit [Lysinimonas soli]|uniref:HlyD family efflux transporter periplasmic adaptor subunit n=1 Tax=Lysinimonas soli TaxID=1074233 RepID=A0ABW0NL50_9MICO